MPTTDHRLARVDDHWLALPARHGVPAEVCAGPGVPIEAAAIDEALAVLDVAATVERLATEAPSAPGAPASASTSSCASSVW
jgi:tRNA-splicing ligase RtcB